MPRIAPGPFVYVTKSRPLWIRFFSALRLRRAKNPTNSIPFSTFECFISHKALYQVLEKNSCIIITEGFGSYFLTKQYHLYLCNTCKLLAFFIKPFHLKIIINFSDILLFQPNIKGLMIWILTLSFPGIHNNRLALILLRAWWLMGQGTNGLLLRLKIPSATPINSCYWAN